MSIYHVLTEWKFNTNANELFLHIYKTKMRDFEKRNSENGELVRDLKKLNKGQSIVFYGHFIASWQEIKIWNGEQPISHEFRSINLLFEAERKLLERLILKTLQENNMDQFYCNYREFIYKKYETIGDIRIHKTYTLDVQVDENGSIFVGFDRTHRFIPNKNIEDLIKTNSISKNTVLIDDRHNRYFFEKIDGRRIDEYLPEIGQSLLDYFKGKNEQYRINGADPSSQIVVVKNNEGKLLYYPPQILFMDISFENIPPQFQKVINKKIKLSSHKKMQESIDDVNEILLKISDRISFNKKNLIIDNNGYELITYSRPTLLFGKEMTHFNPLSGLNQGGVYETKPLTIHYFVDGKIIEDLKKNNSHNHPVLKFIKEMESLSNKMNVPIQNEKLNYIEPKEKYVFSNPIDLRMKLKDLGPNFKYPTVIITKSEYEKDYEVFKKEISAVNRIPTQIVNIETLQQKEDAKIFTYINILLGIYAKSEIQPWILKNPLNSDCFIGLDVSHEDGRHTSGIVQVVGKDGRVLSSRNVSSSEAGEKISANTLEEIIFEVIHQYRKVYGTNLNHLTIHRDGKSFSEEIQAIQDILDKQSIAFDYVSVIKRNNRRMAIFDNGKWETKMGMAYVKGNMAYLCATDPKENVGMAVPLKIVQQTNELNIKQIISDIYHLSFMHIGSLNKSRLPITTHYADLSSTQYNRGFMPKDHNSRALYFV